MLKPPLHLLPCQMMKTPNMVLSCVDLVRMGKILDTWNVMSRMEKETVNKINATSHVNNPEVLSFLTPQIEKFTSGKFTHLQLRWV